ncbi:hypothetical protein G6F35_005252 [Rhizopus arrhizus]|nr:hypothetical protein G6F35_005252 [Rhizopus arrhizus]
MELHLPDLSETQPSGKAYAIGSGESFGELGLGDCVLVVNKPTLIEVLKEEDVMDVQSSSMHSLALTKEGKIWSWGGNEFGALGREGLESLPRPLEHASIKYIKFSKIACGYTYSMAISSKGQLYAWGTFTSSEGVFGYLPGTRIQPYPRILDALSHEGCVDMAVGKHHALCLTREGSVYGWGCGEYWQLGYKANEKIKALMPQRLGLTDIVSITAGAFHSLALDRHGQLYGWGQNQFGQCGLFPPTEPTQLVLEPTLLPFFQTSQARSGKKNDTVSIRQVAAGDHHSIVLMTDNSLVVFGRCSEGQLGIPLYPGFLYPGSRLNLHNQTVFAVRQPITSFWRPTEPIVKLTCGCNSTFALTQSGKLFFWGVALLTERSEEGRKMDEDRLLPVLFADLSKEKKTIVSMSIGDSYSILILKSLE